MIGRKTFETIALKNKTIAFQKLFNNESCFRVKLSEKK
jgi:hypothetical protein